MFSTLTFPPLSHKVIFHLLLAMLKNLPQIF